MEVDDNQMEDFDTPRRQTARPKPRTIEMLKKSKPDDDFTLENEEVDSESSSEDELEPEEIVKTPSQHAEFKKPTSASTKKALRRTSQPSDHFSTPKNGTRSPATPTSGPGVMPPSEFKMSSRGRHIVPPLEYWRLQAARTDAYGNLVQVTLVSNGDLLSVVDAN